MDSLSLCKVIFFSEKSLKLAVLKVTFLRLRDGRGWAFDSKPNPTRWGWWPFASGGSAWRWALAGFVSAEVEVGSCDQHVESCWCCMKCGHQLLNYGPHVHPPRSWSQEVFLQLHSLASFQWMLLRKWKDGPVQPGAASSSRFGAVS